MTQDLTLLESIADGQISIAKMTKTELVEMVAEMINAVSPRDTFDLFMLKEDIKALATNTLIVYVESIKAVNRYGLTFPMTEQDLVGYLETLFSDGISPATVSQRMAAISKLHNWLNMTNPVTKRVRLVYKNRLHDWTAKGNRQRQARALLKRDVFKLLNAVHGHPLKILRDTALLLVGYTGAMRRAELCSMQVEDLTFDDYGVKIHLRTTKTHKFGDVKRILAEPATSEVCPVRMLKAWLQRGDIKAGSVWRAINRHGQVQQKQLTAHGFNYALKQLAERAGMNAEQVSGHSLRAGVCTQLAIDGVATYKIQRLGAWSNLHMLHERYLREVDMITDNATSGLWSDAHLSPIANKVSEQQLLLDKL